MICSPRAVVLNPFIAIDPKRFRPQLLHLFPNQPDPIFTDTFSTGHVRRDFFSRSIRNSKLDCGSAEINPSLSYLRAPQIKTLARRASRSADQADHARQQALQNVVSACPAPAPSERGRSSSPGGRSVASGAASDIGSPSHSPPQGRLSRTVGRPTGSRNAKKKCPRCQKEDCAEHAATWWYAFSREGQWHEEVNDFS